MNQGALEEVAEAGTATADAVTAARGPDAPGCAELALDAPDAETRVSAGTTAAAEAFTAAAPEAPT